MKWISVNDKLPEKDQTVLGFCPDNNEQYVVYYDVSGFWGDNPNWSALKISHWMPLPKNPKD